MLIAAAAWALPVSAADPMPAKARGYQAITKPSKDVTVSFVRPGRTADAILALDTARDASDVAAAARSFEVPSQNIVFATTDGHIGYQAPGRIPVRGDVAGDVPSDGSWPRPGWDSAYDWRGWVPADQMLRLGQITLDKGTREVKVSERKINLTPTEFDLLALLMQNPGQVYSRLDLLERLQDTSFEGVARTIDVHVRNLRTKIEVNPANPLYIETVFGVGYRIRPE